MSSGPSPPFDFPSDFGPFIKLESASEVLCDGFGLSFGLGFTSSVATCFVGCAFLTAFITTASSMSCDSISSSLDAAAFAAVGCGADWMASVGCRSPEPNSVVPKLMAIPFSGGGSNEVNPK